MAALRLAVFVLNVPCLLVSLAIAAAVCGPLVMSASFDYEYAQFYSLWPLSLIAVSVVSLLSSMLAVFSALRPTELGLLVTTKLQLLMALSNIAYVVAITSGMVHVLPLVTYRRASEMVELEVTFKCCTTSLSTFREHMRTSCRHPLSREILDACPPGTRDMLMRWLPIWLLLAALLAVLLLLGKWAANQLYARLMVAQTMARMLKMQASLQQMQRRQRRQENRRILPRTNKTLVAFMAAGGCVDDEVVSSTHNLV